MKVSVELLNLQKKKFEKIFHGYRHYWGKKSLGGRTSSKVAAPFATLNFCTKNKNSFFVGENF
jgi:hypothetical protein